MHVDGKSFHCFDGGDDAEICEIAAVERSDQFRVYILPKRGITPGDSAVNKLSVKHGVFFMVADQLLQPVWMTACQSS